MINLSLRIDKTKRQRHVYVPFLDRLGILFSEMDRKYNEVADFYGFVCTGCENNCCLARFYHHSLLEYLYLYEGYVALAQEKKISIMNRAMEVTRKTTESGEKGLPVRQMCPLNFKAVCILYNYRPMICRLHGIPHELARTGRQTIYGPGCDQFTQMCREKPYSRFDRTPFYTDMAALEKDLRKAVGFSQKLKWTVAEMIISFSAS